MIGLQGYLKDAAVENLIVKYKVGGVILLEQNIQSSQQLTKLLKDLKIANEGNRVNLFFSVDEEGGRVERMPKDLKRLPSAQIIGESNNETTAYTDGNIIGTELQTFGFNLDFAPVMDINSNPNNKVIGDRAFGNTPEKVTEMAMAVMKGIQATNTITCLKHFPGHGDTEVDSHVGLPIVNNNIDRLRSFELIPFKEGIKAGADMVMVAHILLPNIDSQFPASMSKVIITDLLRQEMGFKGVVITDDLTMGAIAKNYDIALAATTSLKAGSDIVLVCNDINKQIKVIEGIKEAVAKGEISETEIDEKVYRILSLKDKYGL
jgi:beta-N-acetylhexosaminidase